MILNTKGQIVHNEWYKTAQIRRNVSLDSFIVMPNHVHGIIVINAANRRGTMPRAPASKFEHFGKPVSNSIPTIIRGFKSAVTRRVRIRVTCCIPVWQRNYYEHIVRDESDLEQIREYIENNPIRWLEDENHPENIKRSK